MNKDLNFAILGPGKISHRFVKGFGFTTGAKLLAVASRDINKAVDYAKEYNIPKAYGSYQEMLQDNEIDAVYIATPPKFHYQQVMMCLEANKHVICEKPFLATKEELKHVFDYAKEKNLFLMEAMKSVFLPTTKQVKKWLDEKLIGDVKYIEASYCYDGDFDDSHWVYDRNNMGGGMFDVGVYPVAYVNALMNSTIVEKNRLSHINKHGSDDFTLITLRYENGVIASLRGAIRLNTDNKAYIYGTKGKIVVSDYWKANKATLYTYNGQEIVFELEQPSEFTYQIQEVIDCIKTGKIQSDIMGYEASLQLLDIVGYDEK